MNTIEYLKHGNPFSYIQRMMSEAQNMSRFARKPSYEEALKQAGERVERQKDISTTVHNDNTWVAGRHGKKKNPELQEHNAEALKRGAAERRIWRQEHPYLAFAGDVLTAAPLAVAAYPFVAGAGEALAGTAAGQAATSGLTWMANAAKATPWIAKSLPWIDAGLTSYFAAHGLDHAINEGIHDPEDAIMTGLELAPLGRLAKPMWKRDLFNMFGRGKTIRTPQVTVEHVANTTPEINKTVINNSQKIPALSLEEIQRAFDQAKQWHLNRINSSGYRNKALRAGFTEEEIPLLQKQLIDQLNRLKLLSPKDAFGPNVKLKINNNSKGPTSAGYWTTLINGKLRQGVELSHPNMSYDDAVSNFIHELGHGATFGLNGTETSGYMKALADQFPLINRLVKYNRTLYPEISARRIELAVPGATRTGNINYYASPSEMLSRGYEFIRDYGINWTKANRAGKLSSTTHKDLVGNRRNSNIFNTIATPKGAINFLKNALGISIPIGIGYDLYNNLSQNEIK